MHLRKEIVRSGDGGKSLRIVSDGGVLVLAPVQPSGSATTVSFVQFSHESLSPPSRPDLHWDSPSFLFNFYRGLYPRGHKVGV